MEAWIAHYPGRGSRHNEAPVRGINGFTEQLLPAMQTLPDKPFAFFGHSLGGLVAFELARHLRRNGFPRPRILFVSGCGAPHLADPHPAFHALPDGEFLEALQQLNGIPSELLDQSELMQLLLPVLRADFEAAENYIHSPAEPALDVPIAAFGGSADPRVSRERLEAWSFHTSSGFQAQYFPGDHFFIHTARDSVISAVADRLRSMYAKH